MLKKHLVSTFVFLCLFSFNLFSQEKINVVDVQKKAKLFTEERQKLEDALIAVLKEKGKNQEIRDTQLIAVQTLAKIGSGKCVPVLISHIESWFQGEIVITDNEEGEDPPTPAAKALANLGSIALLKVLQHMINTKKQEEFGLLVRVLKRMYCDELVKLVLIGKYHSEKNSKIKEKIAKIYKLVVGKEITEPKKKDTK